MKIPPLMEYSKQSEPTAGENVMSEKRGGRRGKSATQRPPVEHPGMSGYQARGECRGMARWEDVQAHRQVIMEILRDRSQ